MYELLDMSSSQLRRSSGKLLQLSIELRIMILQYFLYTDEPLGRSASGHGRNTKPVIRGGIDTTIIRTCRQSYREGYSILYHKNTAKLSIEHSVHWKRQTTIKLNDDLISPKFKIGIELARRFRNWDVAVTIRSLWIVRHLWWTLKYIAHTIVSKSNDLRNLTIRAGYRFCAPSSRQVSNSELLALKQTEYVLFAPFLMCRASGNLSLLGSDHRHIDRPVARAACFAEVITGITPVSWCFDIHAAIENVTTVLIKRFGVRDSASFRRAWTECANTAPETHFLPDFTVALWQFEHKCPKIFLYLDLPGTAEDFIHKGVGSEPREPGPSCMYKVDEVLDIAATRCSALRSTALNALRTSSERFIGEMFLSFPQMRYTLPRCPENLAVRLELYWL